MIGINFDRARAEYFIDCLKSGKTIDGGGSWTCDDMIMLAGAAFFAVSSHGPWQQRLARALGKDAATEAHPELDEARNETHLEDLHGAVEFCAELSQQIVDGGYDDAYEQIVAVLLRGDTRQIRPLKGFRKLRD